MPLLDGGESERFVDACDEEREEAEELPLTTIPREDISTPDRLGCDVGGEIRNVGCC